MRRLPRMWWRPRMRLSRLRRMQSLQGLQMWCWLWRMRRLWWLRRWLDRDRRTLGLMCRLLRILGPVPLVLSANAF